MSGTGPAVDSYVMGRSAAETERLIRQSGLYAPFTRRLFEQAGLRPGMRVLEVGTGAGDADTATDFTPSQGDTKDNTVETF